MIGSDKAPPIKEKEQKELPRKVMELSSYEIENFYFQKQQRSESEFNLKLVVKKLSSIYQDSRMRVVFTFNQDNKTTQSFVNVNFAGDVKPVQFYLLVYALPFGVVLLVFLQAYWLVTCLKRKKEQSFSIKRVGTREFEEIFFLDDEDAI